MKFSLDIPSSATMRVGKETYISLAAGTEIHRIHSHRFGAGEFNDTSNGDARFSPIWNTAGAIIPTIYGAQSFECAACEIILRCPDSPPHALNIVQPLDYIAHDHSVVLTSAELKLVDLTIAGQRRLGVDHNALLAGPKSTYPATRDWAQKIHASCPDAQGIYYNSFQSGPQFAFVLFGDRVPAGLLSPQLTRRVADSPCHDEISALADALSIEYQDI